MLHEIPVSVSDLAQKAAAEAYEIFKAYRRRKDVREHFARCAVMPFSTTAER